MYMVLNNMPYCLNPKEVCIVRVQKDVRRNDSMIITSGKHMPGIITGINDSSSS